MNKYFLLKDGQHDGPFSLDDLKSKKLKKTELVWAEGMEEWQKAGEVEELSTILVVTPPPPPKNVPPPPPKVTPPPPPSVSTAPPPPPPPKQNTLPPQPQANPQPQATNNHDNIDGKPGGAWIVVGYIFALLGGLIGVAIGAHLKMGKEKLPNGEKVKKFDEKSQRHGLIILIIAILSAILWMSQS